MLAQDQNLKKIILLGVDLTLVDLQRALGFTATTGNGAHESITRPVSYHSRQNITYQYSMTLCSAERVVKGVGEQLIQLHNSVKPDLVVLVFPEDDPGQGNKTIALITNYLTRLEIKVPQLIVMHALNTRNRFSQEFPQILFQTEIRDNFHLQHYVRNDAFSFQEALTTILEFTPGGQGFSQLLTLREVEARYLSSTSQATPVDFPDELVRVACIKDSVCERIITRANEIRNTGERNEFLRQFLPETQNSAYPVMQQFLMLKRDFCLMASRPIKFSKSTKSIQAIRDELPSQSFLSNLFSSNRSRAASSAGSIQNGDGAPRDDQKFTL